MKKIAKYQTGGKAADKTATKKPTIRKSMQNPPEPTYRGLEQFRGVSKRDSTEYKEGFKQGLRKLPTQDINSISNRYGNYEGQEYRKPFKKPTMKSGGKVKKGGMAAFEKTAFDKKADKPGGRHGKENSAKDKKMDKIDAKKMGYIKKSGGKAKKK